MYLILRVRVVVCIDTYKYIFLIQNSFLTARTDMCFLFPDLSQSLYAVLAYMSRHWE